MSLLVGGALAVTHLLTALAALGASAVRDVASRRGIGIATLFFGVCAGAWVIYGATGYFDRELAPFLKRAFRVDLLWDWNIGEARAGSAGHQLVANIRLLLTAVAGVLGACGVLLAIRKPRPGDRTLLALGGGVLLSLIAAVYGTEMFMRAYLFLLPVLACMAARMLESRWTAVVFCALTIAACPLSVVALHGNSSVDDVTPAQRAYWGFLRSDTQSGHLAGGGIPMEWTLGYAGRYTYDWDLRHSPDWEQELREASWVKPGVPNYLAITNYERAIYSLMLGMPDAADAMVNWLDASSSYDRIYSSGEVTGYMFRGP